MKRSFGLLFTLPLMAMLLAGCSPLSSIPYSPTQTPESWLTMQPYMQVRLGAIDFVLVQPSSTLFVYLLGCVAIGVGARFYRSRGDQRSRAWWGIALVLWGAGALAAGTSYQAFSYEIKCAGRAICAWTSGWEIVYLLLSVASIDAMLVGAAYASSLRRSRAALMAYAGINFAGYIAAVAVGVLTLTPFLISFELLLIVATPTILILFAVNGWRYYSLKSMTDLALFVTWLWLGVVIAAYYGYLVAGISERLWSRGQWFSENDVLHIGLISWMIYMSVHLYKQLTDRQKALTPLAKGQPA